MSSGPNHEHEEALHRKYLEERDKRLRADGEEQFIAAKGEFADFAADPYIEEPLVRDPIEREIDVLVVGGGFGGMLTGMKLLQEGIDSFLIVEMAGDFGGTWYWNRYPGVRCDIESYVYLPRLEEVGTVPKERYSTGREIFEHSQAFSRHYGLYDHALFQSKVEKMVWDEEDLRWHVTTDRGDLIRARSITVSQGPLATVKLPGIEGIRDFKGKLFHSARWDYDYTGGTPEGGYTKLADKRIAVIGTGATAVQIVPMMAEHAGHLYVFQRTPSAVAARHNVPTDTEWFTSQPEGWQRERMENFLEMINFHMPDEDLLADCWTDFFARFGKEMRERMARGEQPDPHDVMQQVDYEKMDDVRAYIEQVIKDPEVAERAKPWYNFLCKRPLYSDDFLESFNRPSVTLVDTDGRGVERITETGLIANGEEYQVDAIIFATGYEVGSAPHKVGQYEVIGRNGVTLDDRWADGVHSLHGTMVAGFPNFHIVGAATQGITAFNFTHVLEIQSDHAAKQIAKCQKEGILAAEPTEAAEERWTKVMEEHYVDRDHFYEECTPGFLNNEGQFRERPTFIGGSFGSGPLVYEKLIAEWREAGFENDMKCIREAEQAAS